MWATIVDRDGRFSAVEKPGDSRGDQDQWPGSRVISAQKANTANAFGLPGLALSTASGSGQPMCGGPGDVDGNGMPGEQEDNVAVVTAHPLNN